MLPGAAVPVRIHVPPESVAPVMAGAGGATVWSTNVILPTEDTLPATSVWRASTVLLPCTRLAIPGAVGVQVLPLSVEYATVAPVSMPARVRLGSDVMRSPGVPVSLVSVTPGATGATLSSANETLLGEDTLPATSVWRTCTVSGPWPRTPPGAAVVQAPPLAEYSTVAPVSVPVRVRLGSDVMRSPGVPVSLTSATTGAAGATLSSVNETLPREDTLPATSVWRTCTVSRPWPRFPTPGAVAVQVVPLSAEYSTVAPVSAPVRVRPGLDVTPSVGFPVSVVSATPGVAGRMLSSVNETLPGEDTLPATSVWRTSTVSGPWPRFPTPGAVVVQAPPLAEYSTVAPVSVPVRVRLGSDVMRSPGVPVSVVSATPGVAGATLSSVNETLPGEDTLPATSVWRTSTVSRPWLRFPTPGAVVVQAPPLAEYSTATPGSVPVRVRLGSDVTLSPGDPVSWASATPGAAGAVLSSVNTTLPGEDTLPATSVWRTSTVLLSCIRLATLGAVGVQAPPLAEYSTVAPTSVPVRVRLGSDVMRSPGVPVSLASATPGAAGAALSSMNKTLPREDTLPATSVWRTCTVLLSCIRLATLGAVGVQAPPLAEYSTVAPGSVPVRVRLGSDVTLSPGVPVSWASATPGAAGTTLSIVTDTDADTAPAFPAASVVRAVRVCTASLNVADVTVQAPFKSAVAVPSTVVPSVS